MSLDDIIKQNKGSKGRGGGGGGRRGRGAGVPPRRGARGASRAGGGVMRGRNRGGIARASAPYTRVSFYHINSSFLPQFTSRCCSQFISKDFVVLPEKFPVRGRFDLGTKNTDPTSPQMFIDLLFQRFIFKHPNLAFKNIKLISYISPFFSRPISCQ